MRIEVKSYKNCWYANIETHVVELNWAGELYCELNAGTPVDVGGRRANNERAIGLLLKDAHIDDGTAVIITGGDVDFDGARHISGVEISPEAKAAISGISWHDTSDVIELPAPPIYEPVVIMCEENQTINGYSVPKLTANDVLKCYNSICNGIGCVITDATGDSHFFVNQADTLNGDISIEILWYSTMLLTYTLSGDAVSTTYYELSTSNED